MLKFLFEKKIIFVIIIFVGILLVVLAQQYLVGVALIGVVIIGGVFILFGILKTIASRIREQVIKEKELEELRKEREVVSSQIGSLKQENTELRNMKVNITQVTPILELGMFNAKCHVKRLVERYFLVEGMEEIFDEKQINIIKQAPEDFDGGEFCRYTGVMDFDIDVVYGVELDKISILAANDEKKIKVYGANPKRLSFKKAPQANWEYSQIQRFVDPLFKSSFWRTDNKLEAFKSNIAETERAKYIEYVNEKGIDELAWIISPMKEQVKNLLHIMFFPKDFEITIEEGENRSAIHLNNYLNGDSVEYERKKLLSSYSSNIE